MPFRTLGSGASDLTAISVHRGQLRQKDRGWQQSNQGQQGWSKVGFYKQTPYGDKCFTGQ